MLCNMPSNSKQNNVMYVMFLSHTVFCASLERLGMKWSGEKSFSQVKKCSWSTESLGVECGVGECVYMRVCCPVLCCAVLCCAVPCRAVPCHVVLSRKKNESATYDA